MALSLRHGQSYTDVMLASFEPELYNWSMFCYLLVALVVQPTGTPSKPITWK
jgi:hypothetical protein